MSCRVLILFLAFISSQAGDSQVRISPPHLLSRDSHGSYVPASFSPVDLERGGMVCIRFNNYWCVKAVGWKGEIGKDSRGHARFDDPVSGARAFSLLLRTYWFKYGLTSASGIIGRYAPSTDCVGSIGKPPDCPYGINPVTEYAKRIAKSVGKKPDENLKLFTADGKADLSLAIPLFQAFSRFELSETFEADPELIKNGLTAAHLL